MSCHICTYWTPLNGCNHFLPDSKTVLEANAYTVISAPNKALQNRVKITAPGICHYLESVEKAARILIHDKRRLLKSKEND